jgi:hypothetical protein
VNLAACAPGASDPEPLEKKPQAVVEDVESVFEALRLKREEWAATAPISVAFKTTVLGGAWLKSTKGLAYDAFKAQAAIGPPSQWCDLYRLVNSARFDISVYGEHGASIMCEAWTHRMLYYYEMFNLTADPAYEYTDSDHRGYEEHAGFTEFASTLTGRAAQRVNQIRSLKPYRPLT